MRKSTRYMVIFALAAVMASTQTVGRWFIARPLAPRPGSSDPVRDAVDLFSRLAEEAVRVQVRAAKLERLTPPDDELSRTPHRVELTVIRSELDRIEEDLDNLVAIRQKIEPWQQDILDHINAAVVGLADNLGVATDLLNENSDRTEYAEAIDAVYDWATYVKETAGSAAALDEENGWPSNVSGLKNEKAYRV